jgi:hypothetical protein
MKTIFDHIERVKGKPHHVRKQVAFASAGVLTALIAVVWVAGSLGTGAFALKDTSFGGSAAGATLTAETGNAQGLAGAAAANNTAAPARIEIVDTASSTGPVAEPTTIPF